MRLSLLVPVLLGAVQLTACRADDEGEEVAAEDAVDLRREFPEPPEGGAQWVTPEMIIPAYTEQEWCYLTTYEGPTVGIEFMGSYQGEYGHHIVMTATNAEEDEYPDGTFLDCTDPDAMPMTSLEPLIVGGLNRISDPETNSYEVEMPEGMAARLAEGQRLIFQSHYVNTSPDPILVQDAINTGFVAEDEVETWTAAIVHTDIDIAIPAGQAETMTVDCTFEDDVYLYYMIGHMHEWGSSYQIEWTHEQGTETIYDIPTWDPLYRDLPPTNEYAVGEFLVKAGDTFRSTCTWYNDEDHEIGFPQEMCATAMMAYPAKVPVVCEP